MGQVTLGERMFSVEMRTLLKHLGVSHRPQETLLRVCDGFTNRQIGRRMGVVEGTIKCHITDLHKRLGCTNRVQLVCWVMRRHLGLDELPTGSLNTFTASRTAALASQPAVD